MPASEHLSQTLKNPSAHSELDAPPADAVAVGEAIARANLQKVVGPLSSNFVPKLATYSNTDYADMQPDGSYKPKFVGKLVWAYIAVGPADPSGSGMGAMGPNGVAEADVLPVGSTCTSVWLADAQTGQYLMGYQACEAPNAPKFP